MPLSLSRSAGVSQRKLQTQAFGDSLHPIGVAKGSAAVDARSQLLKLFLIEGSVDLSPPVSGPINGPLAKGKRLSAPPPGIQPAPWPILRTEDQTGPGGVGFDISADVEEVAFLLNGEALEATLIKVPAAAGVIVGVVATHVSYAYPTHESAERIVGSRANHQMPVVAHQTVGEQINRVALQPLG